MCELDDAMVGAGELDGTGVVDVGVLGLDVGAVDVEVTTELESADTVDESKEVDDRSALCVVESDNPPPPPPPPLLVAVALPPPLFPPTPPPEPVELAVAVGPVVVVTPL